MKKAYSLMFILLTLCLSALAAGIFLYPDHLNALSVSAPPTAIPTLEPVADARTPDPNMSVSLMTEPTSIPTPQIASIGFVGDILMMKSQIETARRADGTYDFTRSFEPMRELFSSVDIMVGNYEGTFGGADKGYTERLGTPAPATSDAPNPRVPLQEFSAPDELASNLKELGFDALTTANNHCLDRYAHGLYRTINVIRAAELAQTGTFLSKADRDAPLIFDVNGIKIGLVAATDSINSYTRRLSSAEHEFAISRLYSSPERLKADISTCRNAGAEFIIVSVHWGNEYENSPNDEQITAAKRLAEYGADAIIGSHPHVVQPIRFIDAERGGTTVRIPVIYSLGNFISNMAPSPKDYGLFVRLNLERGSAGSPISVSIEYLPVFCIRQKTSGGETLHQTLPCYENGSLVTAYEPLSKSSLKKLADARAYVTGVCGANEASVIDDPMNQ